MRRRNRALSTGSKLASFDNFGHQVGVNYKGDGFYKTNLGAILSLMTFMLVLTYAGLQSLEFMRASNANVISMMKRIDRRHTEKLGFAENQFNLAFEFVQYTEMNTFQAIEIPDTIARLVARVHTEVIENGVEIDATPISFLDCSQIHPDLIHETTPIGGADSTMYCLTPE